MIPIEDIQKKYGAEIALLLLCGRVFLKTAESSALKQFAEQNNPDWQKVYELAKVHCIRPIVYETIISVGSTDIQLKDKLKRFCLEHSLYSFRCQQRAAHLISMMKEHNITIQLYKGIHLSQTLYNHLSIREFGDIDFIVRKEHVPRLISVLKEAGHKVEGEELFVNSQEDYLSHQKDVICYDEKPDGSYLYEFHYKPVGSYLAMDLSFENLLPSGWQTGSEFSGCDYLPLLTVNHGLVDLYPTLRCMIDIAALVQKCGSDRHYKLNQKLEGYYALNEYLAKQLFNVDNNGSAVASNRITSLGKGIIQRLFKKKEAGRVRTSTILKTSFLLRKGISEKLRLIKAVTKYILTPNYNDAPETKFKYKWMHIISRPFRLIQHAKRHV